MGMLLCGLVQAEWTAFVISKEYGNSYYDPDRISQLPDGRISYWIKFRFVDDEIIAIKKIDSSYEDYLYHTNKRVLDCKLQQVATIETHMVATDGRKLLSTIYKPSEWIFTSVLNDSIAEELIKLACKK